MSGKTIAQLGQQFALQQPDNKLHIRPGEGNIPVIEVFNRHGSALISLQGAQLISWIPSAEAGEDAQDLLWLSQDAVFAPGKSLRGGIPVCWPWFGQHPQHPDRYPAHGFARTRLWQIDSSEALADGRTRIRFSLQPGSATPAVPPGMWPPGLQLQYSITLGEKLELELHSHNLSEQTLTISEALHSYFRVGDIGKLRLHGLDDTDYLDKPDGFRRKHQHGAIRIDGEIDRIYVDTSSDCVIEDPVLQRNIIIRKCASHSTVVWNPGEQVAQQMGDLGHNGYRHMLCVESGNAADNRIKLAPGKSHRLWVQYEIRLLRS